MKPALLVIDIQNAYLDDMSENEKKNAFQHINWAISLFRHHGFPVIRIYHHEEQRGPHPGDPKFEFPETIAIKGDDPKIVKHYPSSFKKTDLEKFLRDRSIDTLYLCGLSAVYCVLATYFGAEERDFNVFFIKNALLSHKEWYTGMIEDAYEAVSCPNLKFMFDNMKK